LAALQINTDLSVKPKSPYVFLYIVCAQYGHLYLIAI